MVQMWVSKNHENLHPYCSSTNKNSTVLHSGIEQELGK